MFSHIKDIRPDCEKILNEKSFWALLSNDIEKELNKFLINENSIVNQCFSQNFIRIKMNCLQITNKSAKSESKNIKSSCYRNLTKWIKALTLLSSIYIIGYVIYRRSHKFQPC